jgi:FtsP/CotA-like multicopper oxidase with cupredoxin domain
MLSRKSISLLLSVLVLVALILGGVSQANAQDPQPGDGMPRARMTQADREAAAARAKALREAAGQQPQAALTPVPGGVPDYFGPYPNWANSKLPQITGTAVISGTGIRKFVDSLPLLGPAGVNNLGQYIPVAVADTTTYPGSDYYEIAVVQYQEKMHSDVPTTTLRGYVQIGTSVVTGTVPLRYPNGTQITNTLGQLVFGVDQPRYLGPTIVARRDWPTRIKFTNYLPTGAGGDLFIPVDTSVMGAGTGPNDGTELYTENRATLHLHGGATPWISDGTPHQWTTPAGEVTSYPEGVSVSNVPDMPDPGPGSLTFFYSNQQSARLMFYHDHAYGITRLNVFAGEAAGYLLQDTVEAGLVASGTLPNDILPLVIQDKTFVPPLAQLQAQDPTWPFTNTYGAEGSLWYPHVYMPNQNPGDAFGANAMGRWDYGPWFWPPFTQIVHGQVANPYAANGPWEGPFIPGTPNPSLTPEDFADTPLVNGTAYPSMTVQARPYRFRILNASNDRFWNLSLWQAASNNRMWNPDGTLNDGNAGEVTMVPASPDPSIPFPLDWTTATDGPGIRPDILDGRTGGVPDPRTMGPSWIQIGTEGGMLPSPVVLDPKPVGYQYNLKNIVVLNVSKKSLWLGPAERADVVVDFSQYAGQTLILYNDSPAPVPANDPRTDYYTGHPDYTATGGAPTTLPGYGPNTRTVMQIKVASLSPAGDPVSAVTVTNGGADYSVMPTVAFTSTVGAGAAAVATGSVLDVKVLVAGSGYISAPTVAIAAPVAGVTATAVANIRNGAVTGIQVTNGGSGYAAAPGVTITSVAGGGGAGATADSSLMVTAISVTVAGAGYTASPQVDLLGGGGYGATAVASLGAGVAFSQTQLNAAFATTGTVKGVFARSQDPIIVPQAEYNSAYSMTLPADPYVRIQDMSITFVPLSATTPITIPLGPKAIQELFELDYGRMNAILGVELPQTNGLIQTTIPLAYVDPVTEDFVDSITPMSPVLGDGTQIWKITHNGVDTHAIHFHLYNVQLINRVGWDGMIRPPDLNELGWKETVKMSPLEDAIVAMRPVAPKLPFGVPNSIRPLNPTQPIGSPMGFTNIDPLTGNPITVLNALFNFGWEYVWHCHLLGHEENDMMRPVKFEVATVAPAAPVLTGKVLGTVITPSVVLTWTDGTPQPGALGLPANEIGYWVMRGVGTGPSTSFITLTTALANQTHFTDTTVLSATTYSYKVIAFNASGSTASNILVLTTPGAIPAAPTNFAGVVLFGPTRVSLSWTNNTVIATNYILNRVGWTVPVTLPASATTYVDLGVSPATVYTYTLVARNAGGSSAPATAVVTVPPNPPNPPRSLTCPLQQLGRITVNWLASITPPAISGYQVQASTNGTTWTVLGTTVPAVRTFTQTGLAEGVTVNYRVRSYITFGTSTAYSTFSNTANCQTQ